MIPFTSCLHHVCGGPTFPPERILFCSFPFVTYCGFFFAKGQFSFLSVSVDFTLLLFSNSASYSETVVIFPEPRPENLTSFQPCLEIADSGLCFLLKLPAWLNLMAFVHEQGLGKSEAASME